MGTTGDVRKTFFDTKAVKDKVAPAVRRALSRFGAFVRTRSRSSIKRKPFGKVAPPGKPPYAHGDDLKRILFGYDEARKSVVIGPVLFGAQSGAPRRLEEGGATTRGGKPVRVRPRPYMGPAFSAELTKLGGQLKALIK